MNSQTGSQLWSWCTSSRQPRPRQQVSTTVHVRVVHPEANTRMPAVKDPVAACVPTHSSDSGHWPTYLYVQAARPRSCAPASCWPQPVKGLQRHVYACSKAQKPHKCTATVQVPEATLAPRAGPVTPVISQRHHAYLRQTRIAAGTGTQAASSCRRTRKY